MDDGPVGGVGLDTLPDQQVGRLLDRRGWHGAPHRPEPPRQRRLLQGGNDVLEYIYLGNKSDA